MKVLIIVSKLNMGGIENMILSSIPYYEKHNVTVDILCKVGGELDSFFLEKGITLIDFSKKGNPISEAYSLYIALKNKKYDIVHSQYSHNSGFFALICMIKSIPFFISVHNQKAMFKINWENKILLNKIRLVYLFFHKYLSIKLSKKIIGHSNANLNYYVNNWKKDTKKYHVVSNGIDFSKLCNQSKLELSRYEQLDKFTKGASKVFIHIGSFKEQKNHKFLIEVFKELDPINNGYRLILLGTGELVQLIKTLSVKLGIESCIYFVGMEKNIAPYLSSSDIFLFPSLYEGFGNVLVEAQYMKLPICASDIEPHYESVYKQYHNFFFDFKDQNDAVEKVNKMISALDNDNLKLIIEEAYRFAEGFSVENMISDIVSVYNQVLSN